MLVVLLAATALAPHTARGDYVESYQEWQATSADTWEVQDLSGAPFNVPANAVVEVAVVNERAVAELWGGVRAVGSALDRRFLLHEAEQGGWDVVVIHVQADSNSQIEHYAEVTSYVTFYLLGYWTCGTYVEEFQSFKAGASTSWEDHNLGTYGVGSGQVAEIVLVSNNAADEREAGVRTNGSSLARIMDLRKAEGGGDDLGSMLVQADATANATIEVYAENDTDVDFYLIGYWSTPPGTYTEKFSDIGSPTADSTWEDVDLSVFDVPADAVTEIALVNTANVAEHTMGVRANGSSLGRLLDLQEAEDGGGDYGRMNGTADAASTIEFYHQDVSDAHQFTLIAYWESDVLLTLSDHDTDQESNGFSGSGGETDTELFAFELDPGSYTFSVTQLVFTLSDIAALEDGDWGGIEIIVDSDDSGDVDGGESTKVGGDGVVSTAAGTITFSTSFDVSSATSYILRADFSSLTQCDAVEISLTVDNITTTACKTGTATAVVHAEAGVIANLVAHWKLDEGSGTNAADSAGNVDGTLTNGPVWVDDGRLCKALDFDGDNDRITFPHNATMSLTSFTLTAWINSDTVAAGYRGIVSKGTSGNDWNYWLGMDGDEIDFGFYNGSDWPSYRSSSNLSVDTWYHFAGTFDNTTDEIFLYLNGTEVLSTSTTDTPTTNTQSGWIGTDQENKDWDGEIDDVRIYNRALTASEIQSLAATYKVIDLGTASEDHSLGLSINDSEQIAGYDEDSATGDTDAWLCEECAFTSISTFAGGSVSEALGINDSGEVVGWSDNAGGDRKAFFYDGSLTDLGTLTDRSDSEAVAVNASSEVVGTAHNFGAPPTDRLAFIYLPAPAYTLGAGINSLGTLGGHQSVAIDINDSGQVVGGAQAAGGYIRPFRWANDMMTDLGTLGGESGSILHRAQAINTSGDVVGMSYTAGGDAHAFLHDGSMTDLGVLTGGDTSVAYDINDDDQVVGTSNVTGGAFHAFIWESSTMTDLNDLIDTNSTWTLIRATGINDDGEIVGWGQNPSGDYHAFLLIQTCSGSGPPGGIAGFEILLASGSGLTDYNGDFAETGVGSQGEPLAEIAVSDADPAKYFTFTVAGPGSDSTGAPGPAPGTTAGFAESMALPRTVTVESAEATGSFNLTISMSYDDDELADWGVVPEDVELHVLDTTQGPPPGVWVPAGTCLGESPPTGAIGDSGFVVHADGSVDFWAVREAPGVFAVGAKARQNTADPMSEDPDATPPPRLCGAGIMQTGLIGMVVLMAMTQLWRRRL